MFSIGAKQHSVEMYIMIIMGISSGKPTKNYGTSPFVMGKSTISMAIFHSYVKLPEGRYVIDCYSIVITRG